MLFRSRVATQDPVTSWDQATLEYDDKRINTPSNLITGGLTSGVHVYGTLSAAQIPKWLSIPTNSKIEAISPDSEVETSFPTLASPPNIHVLFQGKLNYLVAPSVKNAKAPTVESMWFTTPSGAAVFNGGFTTWACDLADSCVYPSITPKTQALLQNVTLRILDLWSTGGIGAKLASVK